MRKVLFIFGDLNDGDIDWLAAVASKKDLSGGSVLIQQGTPVAEVYILLDGSLSVHVEAPDKEPIARLLPGEMIGELSFLDSRPPNATVIATTNSSVLAIPRDKLSAKLQQDMAFAARFYRSLGVFLANRLRQTVSRLGFGGPDSLTEDEETADEMDPELLDTLSLAAKRFEILLERFKA